MQKKRKEYLTPTIEMLEARVEKGFGGSGSYVPEGGYSGREVDDVVTPEVPINNLQVTPKKTNMGFCP